MSSICNWYMNLNRDSFHIRHVKRFFKDLWQLIKDLYFKAVLLLNDIFVSGIASEEIKNLPYPYMYVIGVWTYLVAAALFIYFFITIFDNATTSKFLSFDSTSSSQICREVYRSLSGEYLLDSNGYWEGQAGFSYPKSLYKFDMNNFIGSQSLFAAAMESVFETIDNFNQGAFSHNLAGNLIILMSYRTTLRIEDTLQVFSFTSTADVVFQTRYLMGSLSDVNGSCPVDSKISLLNSRLTIQYDYNDYMAADCDSKLDPRILLFVPEVSGKIFTIAFNVNTLVTALAVNNLIIDNDLLDEIEYTRFMYTFEGVEYLVASFYYFPFPGMDPVLCLWDPAFETTDGYKQKMYCLIQIGELYALPLFEHAGSVFDRPSYCDCNADNGNSYQCHYRNLMVGLMFFHNPESNIDTILSMLNYVFNEPHGTLGMGKQIYNATFDAANPLSAYKNDTKWRENAYQFCRKAERNATCSIIGLQLFDEKQHINEMFYQFPFGSCNGSLHISDEARDRGKEHPPVPLVEPYNECRQSDTAAAAESIGLAMGNVGAYSPIIAGICVVLFLKYMDYSHKTVKKTYTNEEKQELLNFFAFALLLARDGKYDSNNIDESLIMRLKDELGERAVISRFLDDSLADSGAAGQCGDAGDIELSHGGEASRLQSTASRSKTSAAIRAKTDLIRNPLYKEPKDIS